MDPIVETRSGSVRGRTDAGVELYRGLPFARPPVGDRRFRAPEPPEPWGDVRDAASFGPSAPQGPMRLPLPGMDVGATAEDCLYLNLATPRADAARRPVLVWIHGGGFVMGSGSQPIFDPRTLARRGDVVVVTINYRLGALGFLHLADLCPDLQGATANAGLLDQVAALHWVRDNVARFGGDPENVTAFGESAGGMSVGTLLGTPAARGLFHRAVAQSGAAHNVDTRDDATRFAASFLASLGLEAAGAGSALRAIPVEKLVEAQQQAFLGAGRSHRLLPFQPVVDGEVVPKPPLDAVRRGSSTGVALLAGSTRDEWKLFTFLDPALREMDEARLLRRVERRVPGADARSLVEAYRRARHGRQPTDPAALYAAIETDRVFRIPAIRLTEAQCAHDPRAWMYRFEWESPALDGALGACHGIEVPFLFGALGAPGAELLVGSGPEAEALSQRTMDAWIAFAREGDPGHAGLPAWPPYEPERRATMLLGREAHATETPGELERRCWEGHL